MGRLDGKVIIVTGAASGQGKVEAEILASHGASVVGTDFQQDKLEEVMNNINSEYEGKAIGIKHDVTDEAAWKNVVETTLDQFGKIDVLVNNAGYLDKDGYRNIEDIEEKDWNVTLNVNTYGNFLGIKTVTPHMKEQKSGSSINISSISGLVGGQDGVHYTASKGGNRLLTKGAAVELGKSNIRVNSIHPGYIDTPMMSDQDVGSIPVVEKGNLKGMITDRDLVIRGIASQFPLGVPVNRIMSSDVSTTGMPVMEVEAVADLMANNQVRRLPILEENRIVGIVALGDVAVDEEDPAESEVALEEISKEDK